MKKLILLLVCIFIASFTFAQTQTATKSRSAKTGQYVTKSYSNKHPATTVKETSKTRSASSGKRK